MSANHLMLYLFEHFAWLDEQLQQGIRARGWPDISRSQSMVLLNVAAGTVRPADIARKLGVSRQAVHTTIRQLHGKGIACLETDPVDQRHSRLILTERGQQMRRDAQTIIQGLVQDVNRRIGSDIFAGMMTGLRADWTRD